MPAPKLLPKRLVNAELATQRKQDIDKGMKLVKSIEALQEAKGKEEKELGEFRTQTISRIQVEIDAKIAERDALETGNVRLREERLLAQAPINLKEEWFRVREDKAANAEWQERNTQQSLGLLAREEENRELLEKLEKEQEVIEEEHALSLRTLAEADAKFSQASDALERAERQAQEVLANAEGRENKVAIREEDATLREVALSKREEEVQAHETDLANRERKLKARQETFLKAQNYIKNKK